MMMNEHNTNGDSMLTENDIGKQFTLRGVADHTYTLVWYSETRDACGVIPSWAQEPTEFSVRISSLRPLIQEMV